MEPLAAAKRSSRRLLFDRRYGWVVDEWKEPSEEALVGGRGMFCVVPLAKALFQTASKSINSAASSAVKVLDTADLFSPQALQANLGNQLQKWAHLTQKPKSSLLNTSGNYQPVVSSSSVETESEK